MKGSSLNYAGSRGSRPRELIAARSVSWAVNINLPSTYLSTVDGRRCGFSSARDRDLLADRVFRGYVDMVGLPAGRSAANAARREVTFDGPSDISAPVLVVAPDSLAYRRSRVWPAAPPGIARTGSTR